MPTARDPRSAARLVEAYPRALAAARSRYPYLSRADHEDIVQEAFAKALRRLDQGPLEDPASYLLRVVFTTGVDLLHDRRHFHRPNGTDADFELYADRSLMPLSPEEQVLARDEAERAWEVLTQELTPEERLVLVRRRVQGHTPDEIATELGVTVRRYRWLLDQARRKLARGVARSVCRRDPDHGLLSRSPMGA